MTSGFGNREPSHHDLEALFHLGEKGFSSFAEGYMLSTALYLKMRTLLTYLVRRKRMVLNQVGGHFKKLSRWVI